MIDSKGATTSQRDQQQQLFRIYTWYRIILAILLFILSFSSLFNKSFGSLMPVLFHSVNAASLVIHLLILIATYRPGFILGRKRIFAFLFADILILQTLTFASGGVGSGLEMVPVVTVAAASIFFSGNIATLIAATAALGLLAVNAFFAFDDSRFIKDFLPTGLIGSLFFVTSITVQYLARRIRTAQALAEEKSADAASLLELNQLIVQRMRTGIIVCDDTGSVRLFNESARALVEAALPFESLPDNLMEQFRLWQNNDAAQSKQVKASKRGSEIQVNFARLAHQLHSEETLVFLEDTGTLAQKAQQLKLASLGRLTASIAHEIRNPLSAISHAAQLLLESDNLGPADKRLSEIITNHCRRVNQIIENVLTLSRRKSSVPKRIELASWLAEFNDQLQHGFCENIHVQYDIHPATTEITFDASHLHQILSNLCVNGLRYSQRQTGKLSLTIRGGSHPESGLPYLDIIDDGEGISDNNLDKIFEPFFTTENSGTGLGLFLAKELCEANQAQLSYMRTDTGKSCFRLNFSHPDKKQLIE